MSFPFDSQSLSPGLVSSKTAIATSLDNSTSQKSDLQSSLEKRVAQLHAHQRAQMHWNSFQWA